ncbi:glycosyltransferase [Chitinophaga sp.]|uniref:glycosyltransferase n=1 Tax=Chitinophaga sp. TaxID=1869181 RepID=UPI0031D26D2C
MLPLLKVAVVTTYPPGKGTLNEYGFYLVKYLRLNKQIRELILITDKLPDNESYSLDDEGCPVTVAPSWTFNGWGNPLGILKTVRSYKPDIVLFNIQFLSFGDKKVQAALGLFTPLLLKTFRFPSVVILHNILERVDLNNAGITNNKLLSRLYNLIGTLLSRLILSADLVTVTISKYVEILEQKYHINNVALVPHGSFETPPMPDPVLPPGPLKIMTFGKFGTYKRVEVLIEAVELLRKTTDIPMEIVIAGTDSPNRKGYLAEVLEQYKHVPGLIFTGYIAEEDVPVIFRESAVVVFPYTSTTGSSGVLHQAGSYGKAVILPDIGDLQELIKEEGYVGEIFHPDDAVSLAAAIDKVVSNDAYRISLGQQNYLAAVSLPMDNIIDWFYIHFLGILGKTKRLSS